MSYSHATLDQCSICRIYTLLKVRCSFVFSLWLLNIFTGKIKEPNQALEAGKGAIQAIQSYRQGDMSGVLKAGMNIFRVATGSQEKAHQMARELRQSQADVVCSSPRAAMGSVLNACM